MTRVSTGARFMALGDEVMRVTNDDNAAENARLIDDANGEGAAIADVDVRAARLHRAQTAKDALAQLSPPDVRAALRMGRGELPGGTP